MTIIQCRGGETGGEGRECLPHPLPKCFFNEIQFIIFLIKHFALVPFATNSAYYSSFGGVNKHNWIMLLKLSV